MLFAVRLDREIQEASKGKFSLDDVMRDLFLAENARSAANAHRSSEPLLDTAVLNRFIERRLGRSYGPEITRFIENGETIELATTDLGQCFERKEISLQPYEAGFNIDASIKAKKAMDVNKASAAFEAGLREGMSIVGWSIYGGDATKDIELTALMDEKRIEIKFLPVAKKAITIPQFMLKNGLSKVALKNCER